MKLMDNTPEPCVAKIQADTQLILFLVGPHWIKLPPLSFASLATYLNGNGIKTKAIDLNIILFHMLKLPRKQWLMHNVEFENNIFRQSKHQFPRFINNLINDIVHHQAKVLGFSLFSRNRRATLDFVNEIRKRTQSKTFVFGGPEVLFEYHRDSFFDELKAENTYFVLGEGEQALLDICRSMYHKQLIECTIHKGKKLIAYNEIPQLDKLPFLDFDARTLQWYDSPTLPLFSSRGCMRRCSFCSEHKLYKNFRQHSPEYVLTLIKSLVKKHQTHSFSFHDSLINANLQWLNLFCELLMQENLGIQWEAQLAIRSDMAKPLFDTMKAAGCFNLFIGLESASDRILALMQKGYDSATAKEFFQKLACAGLHYEVSIITGFPRETEDDFEKTLQFLKNNKHCIPKIAQVNPFVEYAPSQINFCEPQCKAAAAQRLQRLLAMFEENKIKYTASFINNLTRA